MRKTRFIAAPNLPSREVASVIVSDAVPQLTQALYARGIEIFHPQKSKVLQDATALHADMLCLHFGGNSIALEEGQGTLVKKLTDIGAAVTYIEKLEAEYPHDCRLNALILGNTIYRNICSAGKTQEFADKQGYKAVNVNQGYSRCSTCIVSEKAIITADTTIQLAAIAEGIDVLLIPQGEIALDGYSYGFIGGAAAKLSTTELAFTGKVSDMSCYGAIRSFCLSHGVTITELTQLPLFDIGGIVQLTEIIQ